MPRYVVKYIERGIYAVALRAKSAAAAEQEVARMIEDGEHPNGEFFASVDGDWLSVVEGSAVEDTP